MTDFMPLISWQACKAHLAGAVHTYDRVRFSYVLRNLAGPFVLELLVETIIGDRHSRRRLMT